MSRAGVDADIAERCLGHVIPGVRAIYDRYQYRDEKAQGFEALAALIECIVNARPNVVMLPGTGASSIAPSNGIGLPTSATAPTPGSAT
jgi:hypothetical protein